MKTKTRIQYRIDTHWDGVIKAFLVTEKYISWWRGYQTVHEEKIYEGKLEREAQAAIDKRVAFEKGDAVKWSSWKDDRGQSPPPECW